MVNWKKYKIIERKEYPAGSNYGAYVRFTLDGWVEYSDENKKFIDLSNTKFCQSWEEGDEIIVDNEDTKVVSNSRTFGFREEIAYRTLSRYYDKYQDEQKKCNNLENECSKLKKMYNDKDQDYKNEKKKREELESDKQQLKQKLEEEIKNWEKKLTESEKHLPIRQWLEFENKSLKEEVESLKQQIEQSQLQQTQISIPPKESN